MSQIKAINNNNSNNNNNNNNNNIANFVKKTDFDNKPKDVTSNKKELN